VDFCMIMKNFFTRKGYDVLLSYTLAEGLSTLRESPFDILFLDNNLPDGNGWDTLAQIVEIVPQIRTYLISAHRNNSPLSEPNKNVVIWEKPISLEVLNKNF
jgi:DNA-binding response OmpR family regulator